MSFLGGIIQSIARTLGIGNDEEERKRRARQQAQNTASRRTAPKQVSQPQRQQQRANDPMDVIKKRPDDIFGATTPLVKNNVVTEAPKVVVTPETLVKAKQVEEVVKNTPRRQVAILPRQPGVPEIAVRAAGSTGANVAGGLVGITKGVVQLPSAILQIPKLVKLGAAKITGNEKAAENAAADQGLLSRSAALYDKTVKPVTDPLTKAELATDKVAKKLSPAQSSIGKNLPKAAVNLLPVAPTQDALVKATKFGKAGKAAKAADEIEPGIKSLNPNQLEQAQQQTGFFQETPPAPAAANMSLRKVNPQEPTVQPTPEAQLGLDDVTDAPAFQRQGRELPSVTDPRSINDELHTNATKVAANPALAVPIQDAFRTSGSQNPLSLVMQVLSKTQNKSAVREMVQELVPGIEGNNLNRTVNAVTGADDVVEVSQALGEAASNARRGTPPLGPLSDEVAPSPAAIPEPAAPVAPVEAPPVQAAPLEAGPVAPSVAAVEDTVPSSVVSPASVEAAPTIEATPQPAAVPTPSAGVEVPSIAPTGETAPAAPNLRRALLKDLGDANGGIQKGAPDREVLNLEQLNKSAQNAVRAVDPQQLVQSYLVSADEVPTLIRTAQDYALGRAALDVFYEMAKNGDQAAMAAASNILDAMGQGAGKSAQFLRVTQEAFHSMPIQMKISKTIQRIKKVNADKYGPDSPQVTRLDDPAERAAVEAQFDAIFAEDRAIREQLANVDAVIAKGATDPGSVSIAELKAAGKEKAALNEQLNASDQRFAETYDNMTPGQTTLDKLADWQRTAMLSAPTGRVADIATTGINIARTSLEQAGEAIIGSGLNMGRTALGKAPGKYIDRGLSPTSVVKAVPDALKKTYNELRGKGEVSDKADVVRGTESRGNRSDINGPVKSKIKRLVKAGTNLATHLSEGVATSEIRRLARQEAISKGFKGDDVKKFVLSREYDPPANVQAKARVAHETVNNLNDNPITKLLRDTGNAAEKNLGPPGKFFKNAIMPFPTWLGGNIFNAITDKNVIASSIKTVNALRKGDAQGVVRNLSKAGLSTAELYGLGYVLSEQGILTNTDANGDSYEGTYFHIGDRYIPVTAAGFFAPNIILGNVAHQAFNNEGGEKDNFAQNMSQMITKGIGPVVKAFSINQLTGGDNYLARGAATVSGNSDRPDKLADTGVSTVSQFVPSALRDVNAVLNNYTGLNPTKEKSETTINGADGKKNYPGSAVNKLKDLIPGVSQTLPRKADVAAPDLFDRSVRGNRDTPGGKLVKADAQKLGDQSADFKKRGVPDHNVDNFDDAVKARFESGEYDKAIEGVKAKLEAQRKNKDIPESKNKKLEDQIKKFEVHKEGKFKPEVAELYGSTGVEEWRKLGDPDSDEYDPDAYQLLFEYDSMLAEKAISGSKASKDKNKYTEKAGRGGKGGSGGRGGSGSSKPVTGGTIGSTLNLNSVSLGDLAPRKITDELAKIPTIQELQPNQLIKKRAISVSRR